MQRKMRRERRCESGWEDANEQLPFCQVKRGGTEEERETERCEATGRTFSTVSNTCGPCENPYLVYKRLSCTSSLPYDAEGEVEGYAVFLGRKTFVSEQVTSEERKKKRFEGRRMREGGGGGGRRVDVSPCEAPCEWKSIGKAKTVCDAWEECKGFVDETGEGTTFLPIFEENALEVGVHGKKEGEGTKEGKKNVLYAKVCKGGRDPSSSCKTCKHPLVEGEKGTCICPAGLDPNECVDYKTEPSFSGVGRCEDRRKKPNKEGVCTFASPYSEGGACSDPYLDPESDCSACKFDLSLAFPSKEKKGGRWCVGRGGRTRTTRDARECLASCGVEEGCEAASYREGEGTCKTGPLVLCEDEEDDGYGSEHGSGNGDLYIKRGVPPVLMGDGRCGCDRIDATLAEDGKGVCLLNQKVKGGESVEVYEGPSSFEEARGVASQNGGRLAVVTDEAASKSLLSAMREAGIRTAYVGAERRRGGGKWRWSDGTPFEGEGRIPFEGAKMEMGGEEEREGEGDLALVAMDKGGGGEGEGEGGEGGGGGGGGIVFKAVKATKKLSFASTTGRERCESADLDPKTGCSSCLSSAFEYDKEGKRCVRRKGIHPSWKKASLPPFDSFPSSVPKEMEYMVRVQTRRKEEKREGPFLGQIPLDASLTREEVERRCATACSKTEGCEGFLIGKNEDLTIENDHTCVLLRTRAGMEGGGEPREGVSTYLMRYCSNPKKQFWGGGEPCSSFGGGRGGKTLFDENGVCRGRFRDKTHCSRFSACENGFEDATVEGNDGSCSPSSGCLPGVGGKDCEKAQFANTLYETTNDFHDATTCPPVVYSPFSGKDCECAAAEQGFHFDPFSGCKQPLPNNNIVCEEGWGGANCDVPSDACGPYGKVDPQSTKGNPSCSFPNGCPAHFDKEDCRRCEDGWGPAPSLASSSSPSKKEEACSIDTKSVCGSLPVLKIVTTRRKEEGDRRKEGEREREGEDEVYCDCRPKNESTLGHWAGRKCDVCEEGWGGENCDLDSSKCHNRGLPGKDGKVDSPNCEGCNGPGTCEDERGGKGEEWTNGHDHTCDDYEKKGWCKGGSVVKGFEWATGKGFKHPEKACCACGGGEKKKPSLLHFNTGPGATCGPNDCEEGWYGLRCDVPLSACDVTAGPRTFRLAPTLADSLSEATPSDPRCDCSNGGQNTGLTYVNGKCVCKEGFVLDSSSPTPNCVSASASCGGNGILTKEGYCWVQLDGEISKERCALIKKKVGTGNWFLDDDWGGKLGVTTLSECEKRGYVDWCGDEKTLKAKYTLGSKTSPNEYVRQECVCGEGYDGDKCEDCAPGYHKFDGVHCKSIKDHCRGRATKVDATGKCICDPPFKGPLCEDCNTEGGFVGVGGVCYDEEINCGSNANLDPSGKCVCVAKGDDFWTGDTSFLKREGDTYVSDTGKRSTLIKEATRKVCQYHNIPPGQPGETCSGDGTMDEEGGCVCNTKGGHPVAAGSSCQFLTSTYCGPEDLGSKIKLEKRSDGSEVPVGCDCDESITGKRIREDSWFFVGPKQQLSGCIYHMGDCPGLGDASLKGQWGTGGFYHWLGARME